MNARKARETRRAAFGDQSAARRIRKDFRALRQATGISPSAGPRVLPRRWSTALNAYVEIPVPRTLSKRTAVHRKPRPS